MTGRGGSGKILVVTNDFPPRRGGIESFVYSLCEGLPSDALVVYTASMPGAPAFDGTVDFPVVRDRRTTLLPTRRVARDVLAAMTEHGCDRVVFGAAAPLGLLAGGLRAGGARRLVAVTHGHEVWWAKVPGARSLLRLIGDQVDVMTYVSEFCRGEIAGALSADAAARMARLSPGVDTERFRPGLDGAPWRERWGIGRDAPVVLSASRLVARKGQDLLLEAWPRVVTEHPAAVLAIVGSGPARRSLERRIRRLGVAGSVVMVPSVPWAEMPTVYAAADVFALPCRTRLGGLEPEALGIVFLEAQASGLPVVVGRSGGAPEAVVDGETGYVVDPRDVRQIGERVSNLLALSATAQAMRGSGRDRVLAKFAARMSLQQLRALLGVDD